MFLSLLKVLSTILNKDNNLGNFVLILNLKRVPSASDMRFHSVCCDYVLLPLVNNETALIYGRAEYSKAGKLNSMQGEKS